MIISRHLHPYISSDNSLLQIEFNYVFANLEIIFLPSNYIERCPISNSVKSNRCDWNLNFNTRTLLEASNYRLLLPLLHLKKGPLPQHYLLLILLLLPPSNSIDYRLQLNRCCILKRISYLLILKL